MKRLLKCLLGAAVLCYVVIVSLSFFSEPAKNHKFFGDHDPDVIAHGGGLGVSPANTMRAFRYSYELGVDVLEMDMHSSSDGHLVMIHDDTVDRTTNGTGRVNIKTLKELRSLDAGYYFSRDPTKSNVSDPKVRAQIGNTKDAFPLRGQGIRIATLQEVFESFPGMRMSIEIKQESPSIAVPFCEMIRKYKKENEVIAASFHQKAIEDFRTVCPEVATSVSMYEGVRFVLMSKILLSRALSPEIEALQVLEDITIPGVPEFIGRIRVVTRQMVAEAHRKNMPVYVWTVNDPERMTRLIEVGVDGIMTDYPERLIEVLQKKRKQQ